MKNRIVLLLIFSFLVGCTSQKPSSQELVTKYYQARHNGNYDAIKKVIGDSITIIEGDFLMLYSKADFHEQLKWDSIFQPSYTLVELKEEQDGLVATVTLRSLRNQFLKNEAMTCDYLIFFVSGKITTITSLDCKGVDWKAWETQRDTLVNWIKTNHPELDGFVNDMTMQGALNYLEAIALYNQKRN